MNVFRAIARPDAPTRDPLALGTRVFLPQRRIPTLPHAGRRFPLKGEQTMSTREFTEEEGKLPIG